MSGPKLLVTNVRFVFLCWVWLLVVSLIAVVSCSCSVVCLRNLDSVKCSRYATGVDDVCFLLVCEGKCVNAVDAVCSGAKTVVECR